VATIKTHEFRALRLSPLSTKVVITDKIRQKVEGYGLPLARIRRVIERWDYQRRAPMVKDARSVERYAWIDGVWNLAVIYVPTRRDDLEFNQAATCHRIHHSIVDQLIERGRLYERKKEDRA
jgi:hypothetical protein